MARVVTSPAFVLAMEKIIDSRLRRTVNGLAAISRRSVSKKYPPASEAGSPPRLRTGQLKAEIFSVQIAPMHWAFGVNEVNDAGGRNKKKQGLWMEIGNITVAARPFLKPALDNHGPEVANRSFRSFGGK